MSYFDQQVAKLPETVQAQIRQYQEDSKQLRNLCLNEAGEDLEIIATLGHALMTYLSNADTKERYDYQRKAESISYFYSRICRAYRHCSLPHAFQSSETLINNFQNSELR